MTMKVIQPTYTCLQPSTGNNIKYRPYTSKEEKSLLLALQEDDLVTMSIAIKNTIAACTDINPENVPYYDLEYIFLQIRSKSVGETIDLIGSCDCSKESKTEFTVDIADTVVEPKPSGCKKIKISGTDYTVEVRHPSIDNFISTIVKDDNTSEVISDCIQLVYTEDEIKEASLDEKIEFIDSLTPKQKKELIEFIKNMPRVKLRSSYTCRKCNMKHDHVLSGFENFFV